MYLAQLQIKKFRTIEDIDLSFSKGVNILIGENNAGKSSIIDALRICLSYGSPWRDLSVDISDFYIDRTNCNSQLGQLEFHLYFTITNEGEAGWFSDLYTVAEDGSEDLQLHFKFFIDEINGVQKIRRRVWGGKNEGQQIAPEILDLFYYVYLEPLRDAVYHLRPVRGNKIGQLYMNLVTDDNKRNELSSKVRKALNEDVEWKEVIDDGRGKINTHLLQTSIKGKEQDVSLDFLPFEFRRIVENLKMQMPVFKSSVLNGEESKQRFFELSQNGLGYNNLIYTATILGHLKQRAEVEPASYMALLIEEPEAHLHPQLQNIFFKYLHTLNHEQFQVFITSHSPTITAKADLDALIILQNQENKVSSLPIIHSELSQDNKKYLQKFLDVTKSQLFFANGVILVEGVSEALLLPVFATIMGDEYDLNKAGIEIVNINGVAFEHFAKLFNNLNPLKRLHARCSILTDDDRADIQEDQSPRAQNALDLESGVLKTFLGEVTFEYELFIAGSNKKILDDVFKNIKPRAAASIVTGSTIQTNALAFVDKVKNNKAKSELAHQLALRLEELQELRQNFTIPEYIQRAIKWVIKGE